MGRTKSEHRRHASGEKTRKRFEEHTEESVTYSSKKKGYVASDRPDVKQKEPFTSNIPKPTHGFRPGLLENRALYDFWREYLVDRVPFKPFTVWYMVRYSPARHIKGLQFPIENQFGMDENARLAIKPMHLLRDFNEKYVEPPLLEPKWTKTIREGYTLRCRDYVKVRSGKTGERILVGNHSWKVKENGKVGEEQPREQKLKRVRSKKDKTLVKRAVHFEDETAVPVEPYVEHEVKQELVVSFEDEYPVPAGPLLEEDMDGLEGMTRYEMLSMEVLLALNHVVPSSLNGNNGSATNTDDHDQDTERYFGGLGSFGTWVRYDGGMKFLRVHEVDVFDLVDSTDGVFNDEMKTRAGPIRWVDRTYLAVVAEGNKMIEVNRLVEFYPILLEAMKEKFRLPGNENQNFTAIKRSLVGSCGALCLDIVVNTFHVYCREIYDVQNRAEPMSRIEAEELSLVTGSTTNGAVLDLIPPAMCNMTGWRFNRRWRVLPGSVGFAMDTDGDTFTRYPQFNTLFGEKNKFMVFSLARILGCKPFEYYETSGFNVTSALSRYMKARPNEDVLYRSQLSLLNLIPESVEHVASLCEAVVVKNNDLVTDIVFRPTEKKMTALGMRRVHHSYEIMPLDERWQPLGEIIIQRSSQDSILWSLVKMSWKLMKFGIEVYRTSLGKLVVDMILPIESNIIDLVYDPLYQFYDKIEWLSYVVQLPAPKRVLYMLWMESQKIRDKIVCEVFDVQSKIKKEPGKFGKAPRLYASMGPGCLYDKVAPEVTKKMFSKPIAFHELCPNKLGLKFFCSFENAANVSLSDDLFRRMSNIENNTIYAVFYSDDGFISYRDEAGELYVIETDISGCDASNGIAVFNIVWNMLVNVGGERTADALLKQCALPTTIVNPSNPEEYARLQCECFFEYSGSVLTTVLNNVASLMIFFSIYLSLIDGGDLMEEVVNAPNKFGWVLTAERRRTFNQVSFLKRSFNGKHSWKNYGCIFRGLGIFMDEFNANAFGLKSEKDFRAKTTAQLFELHLRQRLDAEVNEPISIVMNAWRERVGLKPLPIQITVQDLIERYGGDEFAWSEFVTAILNLRAGDNICCDVTKNIFKVDYGVA